MQQTLGHSQRELTAALLLNSGATCSVKERGWTEQRLLVEKNGEEKQGVWGRGGGGGGWVGGGGAGGVWGGGPGGGVLKQH